MIRFVLTTFTSSFNTKEFDTSYGCASVFIWKKRKKKERKRQRYHQVRKCHPLRSMCELNTTLYSYFDVPEFTQTNVTYLEQLLFNSYLDHVGDVGYTMIIYLNYPLKKKVFMRVQELKLTWTQILSLLHFILEILHAIYITTQIYCIFKVFLWTVVNNCFSSIWDVSLFKNQLQQQ